MFFKRINTKSHYTDEELIRQYQATANPVFIGELYQRYTHLVFGVCLKYLKDEEDSKDAVMQIFEKLLQVLKTQEVNKFQSWLHVLIKNYCLTALRTQKLRSAKSWLHEIPDLVQTPDHTYSEEIQVIDQRLPYLEKGLSKIPNEQKICLELFYFEKKSYQEIAMLTGYELSKVKSFIQNGKRNLKIYLQKQHDQS